MSDLQEDPEGRQESRILEEDGNLEGWWPEYTLVVAKRYF